MIRRLWRWLVEDGDHAILHQTAADLAGEIRKLTDEQQRNLFSRYTQFWWQANRVAACVDVRAGESL
ncbi:hypothetical protein [Nonomuraea sp. NPDC050202]|uniref:hypothetical protein n=1 Tax=Nonomuraea sp. NPDC050202 TaxID=3155035 RepID=UPI00340BD59E